MTVPRLRRVSQSARVFNNVPLLAYFPDPEAKMIGLKYVSGQTGLGNGDVLTLTFDSIVMGDETVLLPDAQGLQDFSDGGFVASVYVDFALAGFGCPTWASGIMKFTGGPPPTMNFAVWATKIGVSAGPVLTYDRTSQELDIQVAYLFGAFDRPAWMAFFQVDATAEGAGPLTLATLTSCPE